MIQDFRVQNLEQTVVGWWPSTTTYKYAMQWTTRRDPSARGKETMWTSGMRESLQRKQMAVIDGVCRTRKGCKKVKICEFCGTEILYTVYMSYHSISAFILNLQ